MSIGRNTFLGASFVGFWLVLLGFAIPSNRLVGIGMFITGATMFYAVQQLVKGWKYFKRRR